MSDGSRPGAAGPKADANSLDLGKIFGTPPERKEQRKRVRERREVRRRYKKSSAARFDLQHMLRTMLVSTCLIIGAVFVFLLILYLFFDDAGEGKTHWMNMVDNVAAFIIGLSAMDGLMYLNQSKQASRAEVRAIIRHNRIIQPAIDMYLARKNMLLTAPGEEVRYFQVGRPLSVRDLKDMYGPSENVSDAGGMKIEMFAVHMNGLNKALMNMVEDIDFAGNPEICDAALKFINATTYGRAALESVISYGSEGERAKRMAVVRLIKAEPDGGDIANAKPELKNVYIVKQMIEEQQAALKNYLTVVTEISASDQGQMYAYNRYE